MTFHLGKNRVYIHPLLPVCVFAALWAGMRRALLSAMLAFALHESGHLIAAKLCAIPISDMELTPLGGVIAFDDSQAYPAVHRFLLALGGPLCSFMGCFLAPKLYAAGFCSFAFASGFAHANLVLFLVNLLPVLPLDGGQMLRAALSRFFSYSGITKALTAGASIVGLLLCALTVFFAVQGVLQLSPAFAGLYLAYAASIEGRQQTSRYITAMIARRQRLEKRDILPVEAIAASADASVLSLLRHLSPGKYHIVYALSPDGMTLEGTLEEKALCEALLSPDHPALREAIQKEAKKNARREAGEMIAVQFR